MSVHAFVSDFAAARQAMVDSQLRPQGVNDPSVIAAMSAVPREKFVPEQQRPLAYVDGAIPLGDGRAMPPPTVTGLLLTALAPLAGETALVVGAGTGYAAAILARMGVKAVALESSATLAAAAKAVRTSIVEGALAEGHLRSAPYDLILIDGAVEFIPDALVEQLKDGGRLAGALVEEAGITRLFVGRKAGEGFGMHSIADIATPALPGFERPRTFTF
jgi:protein-L-isoaspartate(D-aspartate) O-methyltransferase